MLATVSRILEGVVFQAGKRSVHVVKRQATTFCREEDTLLLADAGHNKANALTTVAVLLYEVECGRWHIATHGADAVAAMQMAA